MAVEFQLLAMRRECGLQDGLAGNNVGRVLRKGDLVDVEMGARVVSEVGPGIKPEIEDLAESLRPEIDRAALVDESYDGDMLRAKRLKQFFSHSTDGSKRPRSPITASGKVVDRDRHLPVSGGCADDQGEQ